MEGLCWASHKYYSVVLPNFVNINDIQLCTYLIITGGVDYNIDSSRVIFPNGLTTASLRVSTNDDSKFETNEKFNVSIDPLSLPYGVILGSTASAVVTIADDDSKLIYTIYLYVTGFGKTDHNVTFCISRNTILKNWNSCGSPVLCYSHAKFAV